MTVEASLLAGVDRALFAAVFTHRLRDAGLSTGMTATERFVRGLAAMDPRTVTEMYLVARACLLDDVQDRDVFDRAFAAVFGADPGSRRPRLPPPTEPNDGPDPVPRRGGFHQARQAGGGPVPWATMPSAGEPSEEGGDTALPELHPSAREALASVPFDQLDTDQLDLVGRLIEDIGQRWPTRQGRRLRRAGRGAVPDPRRTLRTALRHGGEVASLRWAERTPRPRRVVMIADVSGSMKPYARAYMHLMRGLGRFADAETFAFATTLVRLTPTLAHRDARVAVTRATAQVEDRFGGTRIASSLRQLLASPVWSSTIRGSVLVIASDGWDTDPPERLAATVARLHRMAHRIVWVNPRAGEPGFVPSVAGMAAALPHCDRMVSGHTLDAVRELLEIVSDEGVSARG